MHGTRDAAINWHDEYSQQLITNGFVQGASSPCTFYHPQRKLRTVVHGDDYISVGHGENLKWLESCLKTRYEIKTKMLGPHDHHEQEVKVLNRIIIWGQNGLGYDADPGHVEILIKDLGLENCTPGGTPGTSTEGRTKEDNQVLLEGKEETMYRAIVAMAKYIAPDRADIAFAVEELAKTMAKPTRGDWDRLKR